jgi:high-affinity nickel-transport protein
MTPQRFGSSLLGVSALASGRHDVSPGQIILLPLLFTAGMSAVDSLDSVFMLSAYTVPARAHAASSSSDGTTLKWWKQKLPPLWERRQSRAQILNDENEMRLIMSQDQDKLLSMSVVLTVISIVVALLISITEFMGYVSNSLSPLHSVCPYSLLLCRLALEECAKCSDAAENDPGLCEFASLARCTARLSFFHPESMSDEGFYSVCSWSMVEILASYQRQL